MPVSAPPHTHALRLDRLRPELVVSGLRARLPAVRLSAAMVIPWRAGKPLVRQGGSLSIAFPYITRRVSGANLYTDQPNVILEQIELTYPQLPNLATLPNCL